MGSEVSQGLGKNGKLLSGRGAPISSHRVPIWKSKPGSYVGNLMIILISNTFWSFWIKELCCSVTNGHRKSFANTIISIIYICFVFLLTTIHKNTELKTCRSWALCVFYSSPVTIFSPRIIYVTPTIVFAPKHIKEGTEFAIE